MALEQEQKAALRILHAIEDGTMNVNDSADLVENADPTLIYLIFTWLRKRYADHTNSDSVLGRLGEISKRGTVAKMMKEGQADSVVEWFEDAYSYRELDANAFVELIIDKLEG